MTVMRDGRPTGDERGQEDILNIETQSSQERQVDLVQKHHFLVSCEGVQRTRSNLSEIKDSSPYSYQSRAGMDEHRFLWILLIKVKHYFGGF